MSGASLTLILTSLFVLVLAYVSVVDLRQRRIPNVVTFPGLVIALVAAASAGAAPFSNALLGALVAFAITGLMYLSSRGGFGMGDVKLSVFAGAVLGGSAVPGFLLLSCILGALGASYALLTGGTRNTTIAYAPYLSIAAIIVCCMQGPLLAA